MLKKRHYSKKLFTLMLIVTLLTQTLPVSAFTSSRDFIESSAVSELHSQNGNENIKSKEDFIIPTDEPVCETSIESFNRQISNGSKEKYYQLLEGNYYASELKEKFIEFFGEYSAEEIQNNFAQIFDIPEDEVDKGLLEILCHEGNKEFEGTSDELLFNEPQAFVLEADNEIIDISSNNEFNISIDFERLPRTVNRRKTEEFNGR